MLSNLPSGTVTFLFTDIEGSTNLAEQYPGALPALLARHNAILQQAIESNHGQIFRMAGDAFCAAFRTPGDALNAALRAQRELQHEPWNPAPVRVRMGIHTGEARTTHTNTELDPYVGYLTLTRVSRVMSTAHGGQILLSNPTAILVRGELAADVSLRDMGQHKLKGLLHREPLWQLVVPDLPQVFPPLQTLDTIPSNLPTALNRLIGRERELQEVKERLAETRLLTLLGPGGTGKTRLALQVAADLTGHFEDRVYFVDLAASRDSEAVLAAIGRTVGLRENSDTPLLEELKGHIQQKKMLSVLDNFEQVTVAAPAMVDLLRDCPELKMLVTSREALHVRGENVFPVPPLALPQIESKHLSLEQLAESEAVQLFVERARAVKPDFQLTAENAQTVAEICVRLDGLPLAIELATARLTVFTPRALGERLGNRLNLLRGGARDLPARQQTLRDTIDWSYELLDAGEQNLFSLLSVFSGATFEAIEAVSSQVKRFDDSGFDVFEGVSSLIDKSLLRQTEQGNKEPRFRMLETIREFAAARLKEDIEFSAVVHRAHATFFADFTYRQWEHLAGEARETTLDALATELENIQTAWRFWTAEGNLEQLGKFTDTLWFLFDTRGWYHATVRLTSDLLQVLSSTVSTPERARQEIILQTSLARALLVTKGYSEEVEQAYARALELCQSAGEIPQLFPVLRGLSSFYLLRAEHDKGIEVGHRILELAERLDDIDMKVEGHLVLGENLGSLYGPRAGLEHLEMAIAAYDPNRKHARRLGLGTNAGVAGRTVSAMHLWLLGFPERAHIRIIDAVALARKLGHPFSLTYAMFHYSFLHLWMGQVEIAQEYARSVMELADEHEFPVWSAVGSCVRGAALVRMASKEQGLQLLEQGLTVYRGLKSPPVFLPLLLLLHARALGASQPADGLRVLNEALQVAAARSSQVLASEFLTLKGELLYAVSSDNAADAEAWFSQAVDNARQVNAPMLELRAAMLLSRLWHKQGKTEPAFLVLRGAYEKIAEGFTFPDLQQARALLAELSPNGLPVNMGASSEPN